MSAQRIENGDKIEFPSKRGGTVECIVTQCSFGRSVWQAPNISRYFN